MAELTNNGRVNGSGVQCTKGIPPPGLCAILGKEQTGDRWHYKSSSSVLFQQRRGGEMISVVPRWWGGSVKGPHRCLRQPQRSALAQFHLCSKDSSCSARHNSPAPSPPLAPKQTPAPALQFWFTHSSPMSSRTPPPWSLRFPGVFEINHTMPPAPAGKQSHDVPLTWWHWRQASQLFLPSSAVAMGLIFFFSFQTFVTEKYSMKSFIPLLLIPFLSWRDNQSFWEFQVFFT